jgi:hypothetical protein
LLILKPILSTSPTTSGAETQLSMADTNNAMEIAKTTTQEAIAATVDGEGRLLSLAAELRNRIYRYVLTGDTKVEPSKRQFYGKKRLLNVCTQIRNEATSIFYEENTFVIDLVLHNAGIPTSTSASEDQIQALDEAWSILNKLGPQAVTAIPKFVLRFQRRTHYVSLIPFMDVSLFIALEMAMVVNEVYKRLPQIGASMRQIGVEIVGANRELAQDLDSENAVVRCKEMGDAEGPSRAVRVR